MRMSLFLSSCSLVFVGTVSAANYYCDTMSDGYSSGSSQYNRYPSDSGYSQGGWIERNSDYYTRNRDDSNYNRNERGMMDNRGDRGMMDKRSDRGMMDNRSDRGMMDNRSDRGMMDSGYSSDQGMRSSDASRGTQVSYESDRDLMNRIRSRLEGDGTNKNYKNIDVRVYNGVVTISGMIDKDDDRKDLKTKIQGIEGVKSVEDKLEVSRSGRGSDYRNESNTGSNNSMRDGDSDVRIKQQIQDDLKGGYMSKGYENIMVDVRNGVVTVHGTVDSESDLAKVMDKVKKVDGVQKVDIQLKVQNPK